MAGLRRWGRHAPKATDAPAVGAGSSAAPPQPSSQQPPDPVATTPVSRRTAPSQSSSQPPPPSATTTTPVSQKTARRSKTKTAKKEPVHPGLPTDTSTFISVGTLESQLAAYTGYDNVGEFRRFIVSAYTLPHWLHLSGMSGFSKAKVLELLRDIPDDFKTDEEPTKVYPITQQNSRQRNYLFALVTAQFVRGLRNPGLAQLCQDTAEKAFSDKTSRGSPHVDITKVKLPNLGPRADLKESEVEQWNRAACLLQYVTYINSDTVWTKRFGNSDYDRTTTITEDHKPAWMRRKPAPVKKPTATGGTPRRPKLSIKVVWKLKASKDHKKHLDDQELEPATSGTVELLPSMNGPQFRDAIRQKLALGQLEGQLATVRVRSVKKNADNDDDDQVVDMLTAIFDDVKTSFYDPLSDTQVEFTTRPRPEHEDLLEWHGAPAALNKILAIEENDVVCVLPATSSQTEDTGAGGDNFLPERGSGRTPMDPKGLLDGDLAELKAFYSGFDIRDPKEKLAWQTYVIDRLVPTMPTAQRNLIMKNIGERILSATEMKVLAEAPEEGMRETLNLETVYNGDDGEESETAIRYFQLQNALTGTAKQVGFPLDLSVKALAFERDPTQTKEMYRPMKPDPGMKRSFYPWQVNGTAWILMRKHGYIPTAPDASEETKLAAKKLVILQTTGALICDQTGTGKTVFLLASLYTARYHVETDPKSGKRIHRMKFLGLPPGLVWQWAEEIKKYWPCFGLLLSYPDVHTPEFLVSNVITSTAVKEYPSKTHWPKEYHYVFDAQDPRTGTTIFVTSYESHAARTLKKTTKITPRVSYNPKVYDDVTGLEKWVIPPRKTETISSNFRRVFDVIMCDEAHKLKNPQSDRWRAIFEMDGTYHLMATATPCINTESVSTQKAFSHYLPSSNTNVQMRRISSDRSH
jgi:hypothetical protein